MGKSKILAVQKKLEKGKGYNIIIKRLLEQRKKRKIKEIKYRRRVARMVKPFNLENLKKKYPLYFLLSNLIDEFADHLIAISQLRSLKEETKEFYRKRRKIDRTI